MSEFGTDRLITIGVLARASGLTPSALRFYADCGLLVPACVDRSTGYRYYTEAQRDQATMIRRLREIAVPLDVVARILDGVDDAGRLLDAHVRALRERADAAAAVAESVRQAPPPRPSASICAATLADAIGQVRVAAASDPEFPVLAGILVEVGDGAVTLTATDRYRLSTRSIACPGAGDPWAVVVAAAELAALGPWLRGSRDVVLRSGSDRLVVVAAGGDERRCATIDDAFPDYRAMLTALPAASTRVVVSRDALLAAIEDSPDARIRCTIATDTVVVCVGEGETRLTAEVSGPGIEVHFASGTLRAALATAVGPDVMLDLSAADQPVVIRSATDGDLTTLAMPTAP
ncbi:MerR-like DNA binding protein [Rhodococcus sp. AG1013]|uniref:DNA polymerase III subunit beta family protein n=1 Tax=Rhodococcus sp. AG1013 TaxID=2183996 RepID=UPI000E0B487C|nr:MerR family transcriptional regulator [Rhodococcus sp. AG1013]RDI16925.1 MerR-like DNA binding protein [Rhodococcus sp. AG1013]